MVDNQGLLRTFALGRLALLGAAAWLGLTTASTFAQDPLTLNPATDPTVREQMYQQLFRDVAELERHSSILKTVVQLVSPTVVHIEAQRTEGSRSNGRSRTIEEAGSGVIIQLGDTQYVVTNRHDIRDAQLENIDIALSDGRRIHPDKVWNNRDTDVAVMQVSAKNLIAAKIGDSSKVDIGDFAVAVGSPFGLSHSVTYGIISAKGRRDLNSATARFVIKTSCRPTRPLIPATAAARSSICAAK